MFCGINPGRVSAAAAAHFANPRNDFWRLLHAARFTPRLLGPAEQFEALEYGDRHHERRAAHDARARRTCAAPTSPAPASGSSGSRRTCVPAWLGFVGKEAYRGVFGERAELGVQERTLADTQLFVLPSTSPANAAVPWLERERWFDELAGRSSGLPLRRADARARRSTTATALLLVRFVFPSGDVWATPGGGIEAGESDEQAIRRELVEECGLERPGPRPGNLGAHPLAERRWPAGPARPSATSSCARPPSSPSPRWTPEQLADEGVAELRWWTQAELAATDAVFAPRRLPELVAELLRDGPPPATVDVGV